MKKYYRSIKGVTDLDKRAGSGILIPPEFYSLSGKIISCILFCQNQIQHIVYDVYQEEVHLAGQSLKDLTSPKSRLIFLSSYNNINNDLLLSTVFQYAKSLFIDVYDLRNALVHDLWFSSEKAPEFLLLSSLDEEARLLFSMGKVRHVPGMTSEKSYRAIIRFIDSVKKVGLSDLEEALKDITLCSWCLMQIGFVIQEKDTEKVSILKDAFLIFEGISHIFPDSMRKTGNINITSVSKKSINI